MEITEHAIHLLAEVESAVHAYYTDFTDLAQGFEHVQRVYHLALILSEKEQADGFIVGMAARRIAFLHLYLQELQYELARVEDLAMICLQKLRTACFCRS